MTIVKGDEFQKLIDEVLKSNKTFVYGGTEVKLTGRIAIKTGKEVQNNSVKFEIENASANKHTPSGKKWVQLNELFEVEQVVSKHKLQVVPIKKEDK